MSEMLCRCRGLTIQQVSASSRRFGVPWLDLALSGTFSINPKPAVDAISVSGIAWTAVLWHSRPMGPSKTQISRGDGAEKPRLQPGDTGLGVKHLASWHEKMRQAAGAFHVAQHLSFIILWAILGEGYLQPSVVFTFQKSDLLDRCSCLGARCSLPFEPTDWSLTSYTRIDDPSGWICCQFILLERKGGIVMVLSPLHAAGDKEPDPQVKAFGRGSEYPATVAEVLCEDCPPVGGRWTYM